MKPSDRVTLTLLLADPACAGVKFTSKRAVLARGITLRWTWRNNRPVDPQPTWRLEASTRAGQLAISFIPPVGHSHLRVNVNA
jgi:hypothetical protein